MRKYFLLLLIILLKNPVSAQSLSSYSFDAFFCPYDSLTTSFITPSGGTTIGGGGPYDDCYYNGIPIGFNFNYCGTTYTSLSASANCWVTLGQTLPFSPSLMDNTFDADLSGTASTGAYAPFNLPRPILAPLWIDVVTSAPNVRYATLGTSPNRKFVIEWTNCGFYNFTGSYPAHICVELILYETSNIVDFHYKFISSGSSNTGLEGIGITGGSGPYPVTGAQPFWSLNNASSSPTPSSTVDTRNISSLPATDQVYRWSYQCTGAPNAGPVYATKYNSCTTFSSILSLDCSSSKGAGISYQWQSSTDSLSWSNVSGATVDTYAASVSSTIYYRCILKCNNSGLFDTTAGLKLQINTPPTGITGGPVLICAGNTATLSDATTGGIWSSSNTSVATIGTSGIITGISGGTSTISYVLPTGCYSVITATINPMPGAISGTLTLCSGSATTLSNSLTGGTWTSGNTTVATIGLGSGLVNAIAPGTATITYSKGSGAVCSVFATVTVNLTPTGISGITSVCIGKTTSLSSSTPGGTWSSSITTVATIGSSTGVVSGLLPGTTLISYTLSSGCATTIVVTVNPVPSAITGLTIICAGQTATLLSPGGGTWISSNTAVATVGSTTGVVSAITPGTSAITYTLPTGCATSTTVTVIANPPAITGTFAICVGSSTTLSNTGISGTWSSSNPGVANINVTTGVMLGIAPGTATITYKVPVGCYAIVTVTINPNPAAITGIAKVCVGSSTVLSNSITGGSWSSANTSVATVGTSSGIVTGIAPGTATITYQLGTGCFATTTVTVNNLPAPITGPTAVCVSATISITDATVGGIWSSSNTTVATVVTGGVVTGISSGTATITYAVFSTGCFVTTTITVSSSPGPISGIATMCVGTSSALSNSVSGGTWISSNTSISTIGYTTGIATGVSMGTATVTYSLGGSCYSTKTVTVYPPPSAITGTPFMCIGTTTSLSGSGGGTWTSSNTSVATVGVSTGIVTGMSAGIATISYVMFSTGCNVVTTVTVNPSPATISGSMNVCIGGTSVLSNSSGSGTWTSSNTIVATIGSSSGIVTGKIAGTSTITFKLSGTGCTVTGIVTVMPPPPAITGTMATCIGSTTTLSNSVTGGTWASGSTAIVAIGSSSGIITGVSAGTTTVTYTPPSGCSITATVTVNPFPSAISGGTALCVGSSITLSSSSTGGTWTRSATAVATIAPSTGVLTSLALGTTVVTYTLPTGCYTTTTITVTPAPTLISGSTNLCVGTTSSLSNGISGGTWTSSNTAIATVGFTSGTVTGITPGTATVTYSLGIGCTTTATISVGAGPAPISGITSVCVGASSLLSSTPGGGTWTSSNTGVATIGVSSGLVTGVGAGTATITYDQGCIAIITFTVNPTPAAISGPLSVCQGLTVTFSNSVTGGTWISSNTTVAVIGSSSGVINGLLGGTSMITYSLGSSCVATQIISVNPVAAITGSAGLCSGMTTTLSNAVPGGTWSSSNTSIATVDAFGVVTGITPGTGVSIIYTTPAGCISSLTITVNSIPGPITGILNICAGQTSTLSNSAIGGSWISSNTSVATVVPATGSVSGVKPGTSIITYSLGSGCLVTTIVTINPSPGVISGSSAICAGSLITLSNSVSGGVWTSSNTATAGAGSLSGVISGLSSGTTIISYTLPGGCAATKTITVNPVPLPVIGGGTLCVGQTTTLFSGTGGGKWSGSPTTIATIDSTTGIVSAIIPGIFSVVYNVSGCTAATTVTVVPNPTAIIGPSMLCEGQSATFSNGVAGGIWTSTNTAEATIGSTTGFANAITSGTLLISYSLGSGCAVAALLVVNPISPVLGSPNVCPGQSIILKDTTLGGTWTSSNTSIATVNVSSGSVTGIVSGVVTISYITSMGCVATHSLTVDPAPPAIKGNKPLCVGQLLPLFNTAIGGTWTSSNTSVANVDPSTGVVTGTVPGTSVIYYSTGGCPAFVTVTVNPNPAPISGPTDVCVLSSVTLIGSGGGTWSSGMPTVAIVGPSSGIVNGLLPGTSNIIYKLTTTGCFVNTIVTVHALPSTIMGSLSVCAGNTTSLSNTSAGGLWTSTNTAAATVNPATGILTGVSAGTSTITYTVATSCFASAVATVNPVPAAISGPSDVCVGSSVSLSSSPSGGTWSSSSPAVATTGTSFGLVTGINPGTAVISYKLSTGCSASIMVTVDPLPAPVTGIAQVCVGFTTTLSDATPGGTWINTTKVNALVDPAGNVTGVSPGTANIVYMLTSTGCSSSVVVTVTPEPTPIIGSTYLCMGTPVTFSDAIAGGTWWSTNPSIATIGSTTGTATGITLGVTTIVYDMGGGCNTSLTATVVPLPTIFSVTGGGSFCAGDTGVIIGLTGSVVGTNYFLYKGGVVATGPLAGTGSAFHFPPQTVSGKYTILAVNTITGCSVFMSGSAIVNAIPKATPTIVISTSPGDTVCSGGTVKLTTAISGGGSGPLYKWYVNGTAVSTLPYYSFIPANGDLVTCRLTSDSLCASPKDTSASVTMTVVLPETPAATLTASPGDTVCEGTPITLTANPVFGGSSPTYVWYVNTHATGTGPVFTYVPVNNDIVYCKMTSNYPCLVTGTVASNSMKIYADSPALPHVTILANPGTSVLKGTPDTLTAFTENAGDAPQYQWYLNGHPISGATTAIYISDKFSYPTEDSVTCMVTSSGLCNLTTFNWVYISVHELGVQQPDGTDNLVIFPNPNTGSFNIKGSVPGPEDQDIDMQITDVLGQTVYTGTLSQLHGHINRQLTLEKTLANGMYLLTIRTADKPRTFHLIIEQK